MFSILGFGPRCSGWRLSRAALVTLALFGSTTTGISQTVTLAEDPTPTPATTIYVSDPQGGAILKFDEAGQMSVFAWTPNPAGLAFDHVGTLYVAIGQGAIARYNAAGYGNDFSVGNLLDEPLGLAFDSNGLLYVANRHAQNIVKINSFGQQALFVGPSSFPQTNDYPVGLAFDQSGYLYVTTGLGALLKFDSSGHGTLLGNGTFNSSQGPAFDNAGNLYTADFATRVIAKFDPGGQATPFANTSGLPYGLAFDTSGKLYVAGGASNTIEKFNSLGQGSIFAFGMGYPYFIATWPRAFPAPVPTPTPTPGCTYDTWTAINTLNAVGGVGVWTGNEIIMWDGSQGGRYNPSTDSWSAISTIDAPGGRGIPVWTGTEMIVWSTGATGDPDYNGTGGRYNPVTDTWTAMSTINAPAFRSRHTAVWTGTEMIVWGGRRGPFEPPLTTSTGGRYNPSTDTWVATSTIGAPQRRHGHTAVWTGSEMIIWGGGSGGFGYGDGGRYNPTTDTWVATSFGPPGASDNVAVWTGSEMIVWGGRWFAGTRDTGGRYNPITDSWVATGVTGVPSARFSHKAVWTGREMIVWGNNDFVNNGGKYNPGADGWVAPSTLNAPGASAASAAFWTGSEMIVGGARYCAQLPPTGSSGSFVIGDLDAVVGRTVYFWGSQWSSRNHPSQGSTSPAFKGFANSTGGTTPNCGDSWQSDSRNGSASPPSSVPSLITVIAASSVTKVGSTVTGNNRKIVVVQTQPGYGSDPGHPGIGTVIAVSCE